MRLSSSLLFSSSLLLSLTLFDLKASDSIPNDVLMSESNKRGNKPPVISDSLNATQNTDLLNSKKRKRKEEDEGRDQSSPKTKLKLEPATIELHSQLWSLILDKCDFKSFYQARRVSKLLWQASSEPQLYLPESDGIIDWINSFKKKPDSILDIDALLSDFERRNRHTKNSPERLLVAFQTYWSVVPEEDHIFLCPPSQGVIFNPKFDNLGKEELKRKLLTWQPYGIALGLYSLHDMEGYFRNFLSPSNINKRLGIMLLYPHLIDSYPNIPYQKIPSLDRKLISLERKFAYQEEIKNSFMGRPREEGISSERNGDLLYSVFMNRLTEIPRTQVLGSKVYWGASLQMITLCEDQVNYLNQQIEAQQQSGDRESNPLRSLDSRLAEAMHNLAASYQQRATVCMNVAERVEKTDVKFAGKCYVEAALLGKKKLEIVGQKATVEDFGPPSKAYMKAAKLLEESDPKAASELYVQVGDLLSKKLSTLGPDATAADFQNAGDAYWNAACILDEHKVPESKPFAQTAVLWAKELAVLGKDATAGDVEYTAQAYTDASNYFYTEASNDLMDSDPEATGKLLAEAGEILVKFFAVQYQMFEEGIAQRLIEASDGNACSLKKIDRETAAKFHAQSADLDSLKMQFFGLKVKERDYRNVAHDYTKAAKFLRKSDPKAAGQLFVKAAGQRVKRLELLGKNFTSEDLRVIAKTCRKAADLLEQSNPEAAGKLFSKSEELESKKLEKK